MLRPYPSESRARAEWLQSTGKLATWLAKNLTRGKSSKVLMFTGVAFSGCFHGKEQHTLWGGHGPIQSKLDVTAKPSPYSIGWHENSYGFKQSHPADLQNGTHDNGWVR